MSNVTLYAGLLSSCYAQMEDFDKQKLSNYFNTSTHLINLIRDTMPTSSPVAVSVLTSCLEKIYDDFQTIAINIKTLSYEDITRAETELFAWYESINVLKQIVEKLEIYDRHYQQWLAVSNRIIAEHDHSLLPGNIAIGFSKYHGKNVHAHIKNSNAKK